MRVTDNRYNGEMDKFDLAVRMIRHEARTGTIRACTGFTEDRIRKLYGTYFISHDGGEVRRRRGKSPRQIARFVNCSQRQAEATVLASLFRCCEVFTTTEETTEVAPCHLDGVLLGTRLCQAFETYQQLVAEPQFSFEWASLLNQAAQPLDVPQSPMAAIEVINDEDRAQSPASSLVPRRLPSRTCRAIWASAAKPRIPLTPER